MAAITIARGVERARVCAFVRLREPPSKRANLGCPLPRAVVKPCQEGMNE